MWYWVTWNSFMVKIRKPLEAGMIMADQPTTIPLLPNTTTQNPAPFVEPSQDQKDKIQIQTLKVLDIFRQILPSNYVSQVTGPYYTLQFQAIAEQIATFQITAQECFEDASYDYTRSEVLYQILGMLVFPDATVANWPIIHGDISYREFLRRMVTLLLQGSTKKTIKEGVELLTTATVEIIERSIAARELKGTSAWSFDDQFTFDINISQDRQIEVTIPPNPPVTIDISTFPDDPFTLVQNIKIVMKALKPAHTIYEQRFLFKEAYSMLIPDTCTMEYSNYYYDDSRRFCLGAKEITGTAGATLTDRTLFSDPTRDFTSVQAGETLTILSGTNMTGGDGFVETPQMTPETYPGRYRVESVLYFPIGEDTTACAYTTSPTGLAGWVTVSGDTLTDTRSPNLNIPYVEQDFSTCVEGEILTITNGNNAGSYRLKTLCGNYGGPVGEVPSGSLITEVRVAPSILRVQWRMPVVATGQSYSVTVDRLGKQVPKAESDTVLVITQVVDSVLTSWLFTQHGPLVKNWGDATPATKQDVLVYNGLILLDIAEVNPYTGKITLQTPITGGTSVRVVYYWVRSPTMALSGLNTEGLVLNKWNYASGRNSVTAVAGLGAMDTARFPFRVVLGPVTRLAPLLTSWRYLGFENEYSALLNSQASLCLNQNPTLTSKPGFNVPTNGVVIIYEGEVIPTLDGWDLAGRDDGIVHTGYGTYILIDNQSGAYDPPDNPRLATYFRPIDLTFPSVVNFVTRYFVSSYTLDGIYTGVGFGINDPEYLFFVGNLVINGVQHIGLLLDPAQPQLAASWLLGPQVQGAIQTIQILGTTQYAVKFNTADLPTGLTTGNRFQIFNGTQAGVYTISTVIPNCDGTTTLGISETFPADYKLYGNRDVTAVFEIIWSHWPLTYRLNLDPISQTILLAVSGLVSGQIIATDKTETTFPLLATSLLSAISVPEKGFGNIWWGSTSSWATNTSEWSFVRYGITPDQSSTMSQLVEVPEPVVPPIPYDFVLLPENQPEQWFLDQGFGFSLNNPSAPTNMFLNKGVASDSLPITFGYTRVEPYFAVDSTIELSTTFKTLFGSYGADSCISLKDTKREVRLGTLTIFETGAVTGVRRNLISFPSVNFVGYLDPVTSQDWEATVSGGGTYTYHEEDLWINQQIYQQVDFNKVLDVTNLPDGYKTGGIFEARLAITEYVCGAGEKISPFFGACFSAQIAFPYVAVTKYMVLVHFGFTGGTPYVYLCDSSHAVIASYAFDWTDGELHSYRVNGSLDGVTITIDDTVQLTIADPSPFVMIPTPTDNVAIFGTIITTDVIGTSTSQWRSFSFVEFADGDVVVPGDAGITRTLGVWKGGDPTEINNWEIPRIDSTTDTNSNVATTFVDIHGNTVTSIKYMDWHNSMDVRIVRNSTWGVTVYRPDIVPVPPDFYPEPPYYDPAYPVSAGWINVEYVKLPRSVDTFGTVAFGALEPNSLCWQEWKLLNYSIYKNPPADYSQPQHMVLNYYNVISSGERSEDVTWETLVVQTLNSTSVSLLPTHIFASSIWKIIDGSTIYTSNEWTFDKASQTATLGKDAQNVQRTFQNANVTVVFIPGKPVTNTYLGSQPLLDGITNLNEGTPPVPKKQVGDKSVTGALYNALEFIKLEQGQTGLIASVCEGDVGYAVSGSSYWNLINPPNDGNASPITQILFASGGNFVGPVIDGSGNITAYNNPLGGLLNQVMLYPIGLPHATQNMVTSYEETVPSPVDTLTEIHVDPV